LCFFKTSPFLRFYFLSFLIFLVFKKTQKYWSWRFPLFWPF
jgi:hypothetical protein